MATAALICSLVAIPAYVICVGFVLSIAAIVLGIIALNQVQQTKQKGKEMAIAGIAIGGVGLVAMGLLSLAIY